MLNEPQLWLVRHGQTEWSLAGKHTSRTDLPLTEEGQAEALALRSLLAGQHFDLVLSSPRQRAQITAHMSGYSPETDEDLAEWDYGDLEGLTTEEVRERYPGWTIWAGPWPGGETAAQVAGRADRVVARAQALGPGSKTLAFAHGHILRVVAARWLRQPPEDGHLLALTTATVSILSWEHGQPVVERWNVGVSL